jgi:hypothetical protein
MLQRRPLGMRCCQLPVITTGQGVSEPFDQRHPYAMRQQYQDQRHHQLLEIVQHSTLNHGCPSSPEIVETIHREQSRDLTRHKDKFLVFEVRHRQEVQFGELSAARIETQ